MPLSRVFRSLINMGTEAEKARDTGMSRKDESTRRGEGGRVSHGKSITSWSMIKRRFH